MYIKSLISLVLFTVTLSLTGCDLGFKEDKNNDDSLEKSNKILSEYKKVQGTYQGKLNLRVNQQEHPVNIEIRIKPTVTFEGRKDGELIPLVTLNGTLKVFDFPWSYSEVEYSGRYWYAQDGKILLSGASTPSSSSGNENSSGNEPPRTSSGKIWFESYLKQGEVLEGTLSDPNGTLGSFSTHRISKDVVSPGEGEEEQERQRRERAYQNLLGTFVGRANNPEDPQEHRRSFPFRFRFFLQDQTISATVDRPNADPSVVIPRSLVVTEYRPDTGLIKLKGFPRNGNRVPNYGKFFARGYLRGISLNFVEMSDHLGPLGEFTGEKTELGTGELEE